MSQTEGPKNDTPRNPAESTDHARGCETSTMDALRAIQQKTPVTIISLDPSP